MKRFLLINFFLAIFSGLNSQNIKSDLIRVNQEFDKFENLSVNIIFSFYCDKDSKNPEESKLSKLSKYNNSVIYEGFGITTFIDKDITLIINKENKTINIKKSDKKVSFSDLSLSINNVLDFVKNSKFEETPNEKKYELTVNKLGIQKIIIKIYKKDFKIKSIEYFQNGSINIEKKVSKTCTNPVSKILFSDYSNIIDSDKSRYSLSYYLTINSGIYNITKNFEGYKVINLLNKKIK